MAEPGTQMSEAAEGRDRLRVSRADREQVIEVLKAAFVQDRLSKDEFDARIGQTLGAATYADLAAVTADIPAGLTEARPPRRPARARVRVSMNTAVTGGACVIVAAHVGLLAALLSGSWVAVILLVAFVVIASAAAVGAMIVAR
jgi:Domain of unknown function (DUF1707)